jgi:lanosterol synthase
MGYKPQQTDPFGWRLKVSEDAHGQHKWVYLPPGPARDAWPQNKIDKYWTGMEMVSCLVYRPSADSRQNAPTLDTPKTALDAARNGLSFYKQLQSDDGHFATEYGGDSSKRGKLTARSYDPNSRLDNRDARNGTEIPT